MAAHRKPDSTEQSNLQANTADDNQTRLFPGLSRQLRAQSGENRTAGRAGAAVADNVVPLHTLPQDPGVAPQTWSDDDGRRRGSIRRALLLTALVLLLAAVIAAVVWGSTADFDALRRGYTYRGVSRDDQGVTDTQPLPAEGGQVACMKRWTVQASNLGLRVQDEDGSLLASCVTALTEPVLRVGNRAALAYDAGGNTICVIDAAMETQTLTTDAPILAADMSAGGGFCYLTGSDDDKTVLTVCSDRFSEIMSWYSKSRYLQTAALSDDGKLAAAVGVGTKNGAYWSSLLLLRTDNEAPLADVDLGQRLVLWADWIGDVCCLVCHDDVSFYGADGALIGSYEYAGRSVTGAAVGKDFLALSLSEGRTGNRDVLVTLSADGALRAELALGREAEQVTAAGNYVAALTPQGVSLYTGDLQPYGEVQSPGSLQSCCVREDGSVLLVNGQGVALYLP